MVRFSQFSSVAFDFYRSCYCCADVDGGDCSAYDEIRRKSGPKRGYVKALEARLGMLLYVPDDLLLGDLSLSCLSSNTGRSSGRNIA